MDIIPFKNTWPYERQYNDIYIDSCPICMAENVLTNMKIKDYDLAREGIKIHLILPCCNERLVILEIDEDYFWTNRSLRL